MKPAVSRVAGSMSVLAARGAAGSERDPGSEHFGWLDRVGVHGGSDRAAGGLVEATGSQMVGGPGVEKTGIWQNRPKIADRPHPFRACRARVDTVFRRPTEDITIPATSLWVPRPDCMSLDGRECAHARSAGVVSLANEAKFR